MIIHVNRHVFVTVSTKAENENLHVGRIYCRTVLTALVLARCTWRMPYFVHLIYIRVWHTVLKGQISKTLWSSVLYLRNPFACLGVISKGGVEIWWEFCSINVWKKDFYLFKYNLFGFFKKNFETFSLFYWKKCLLLSGLSQNCWIFFSCWILQSLKVSRRVSFIFMLLLLFLIGS